MDLKKPGNLLYVLGETRDELGGSRYGVHRGTKGGGVPHLNPKETWPLYERLGPRRFKTGLVASCHDCSEGGLGVTLAEMAMGGGMGAVVDLRRVPTSATLASEKRSDKVLFSESNGRFVVEVAVRHRRAFMSVLKGLVVEQVGEVRSAGGFARHGFGRKESGLGIERPPIGLERKGRPAMTVKALVLRAPGTNCDVETSWALEAAGADPQRVHVNALLRGEVSLDEFGIVVFPGGFSFGDDIASGKVLANRLVYRLREQLDNYLSLGRPIVGICNGFQVLVKAGLLPGPAGPWDGTPTVTLTDNDSGRFECRWIHLKTSSKKSFWAKGLPDVFPLPVAHGEGKFVPLTNDIFKTLEKNGQVIFRYVDAQGRKAPVSRESQRIDGRRGRHHQRRRKHFGPHAAPGTKRVPVPKRPMDAPRN
jgi:phosphoribosylformylglycinamidine synthase I